jgi:hypothetical protein
MSGRIGPSKYISNNYSLDFDGVDDYLEISNSTIADSGQFTLSFWIKSSPATGNNIFNVLFSSEPYYNLNRFWVMNGANIQWVTVNNVPKNIAVGVLDNTWHHIMIIWNPDGANSTIRSYIDGANEANAVTDYRYAPDWNGGAYQGPINFIGGNNIAGYKGVIGTIDEFAAFEGDRSADLASIYNKGVPANLNKLPVPPLQWFRMGDNGVYKDPQWLIPNNENKNKVSNYSTAFDGLDDSVEVGTQSLGITGSISVSAWVKIPTTNTGGGGTNIQVVAGEDVTSTGRNWLMYWRGGGQDYFSFAVFHTDGSSTGINSTGIVPNDGEWHHLLGTYDGTTSVNGLKLFVDGNIFQTTAGSSGVSSVTGVEPTIGSLSRGLNWFFEGNIDEVSIWDNVVSIGNIWNGSGSPIDITPTNPFAYWKMGENATFVYNVNPDGTWIIPDEVGSNDGTSNNLMVDSARVGESPNSENNALSFNMDLIDRVPDTPPTP